MQEKQAIIQCLHTLYVWSPIQRRRIGESWRIFKSLSQVVQNPSVTRISRPDTFLIGRSPDTCYHKVVTNAWSDWFPVFISQLSTGQYCHVSNTLSIVDKDFFQDADFAEGYQGLQIQVSHIRTDKLDVQTANRSFPQSSTEAEVILGDACPWLERIPALNLWDVVDDFLESPVVTDPIRNIKFQRRTDNRSEDSIDYVFSKLTHLQSKIVYVCLRRRRCRDHNYHKKTGARPWHISPEPTVWTWIGCWTDRNWMLEVTSNKSAHLNKYLTLWPKIITADTFNQSHYTAHCTTRAIYQLNFAYTEQR